ncbi:MAG: transcription initiation factor TFIID subunit TAF10 [Amphiamblys sp. WSBS2006]|nr:MAG: transcription initiation factor TFIID subunit TAF10 [Amphiamblys sp. WSBS2006]
MDKKKKDTEKLLEGLDSFESLIPDTVLEYYLMKNGVVCKDPKVKKLIGLVAQKHISDVASDALQFNALTTGTVQETSRATLTSEDICNALSERGVNIRKPPYFV